MHNFDIGTSSWCVTWLLSWLMYCMGISFPVAVFTAMWQIQFPIKNQKDNHPAYQILVLKCGCIKFCTTLILFRHEMSFWRVHPRSRQYSSFLRLWLITSTLQFFLGRNIRILNLCHSKACCTNFALLYRILTLLVVIMPWRIFHNNYCIHKSPWFEHCTSFFQFSKSFLNRTVIDVCMSKGSQAWDCTDINLLWWMVALITFPLYEDGVGVCGSCVPHCRDSVPPSSGCWCYERHYWSLFMYEVCPESIKPYLISREPVAWPWCNLAAS
jgi:hypothetical protein